MTQERLVSEQNERDILHKKTDLIPKPKKDGIN
jgi:hypothetical protein